MWSRDNRKGYRSCGGSVRSVYIGQVDPYSLPGSLQPAPVDPYSLPGSLQPIPSTPEPSLAPTPDTPIRRGPPGALWTNIPGDRLQQNGRDIRIIYNRTRRIGFQFIPGKSYLMHFKVTPNDVRSRQELAERLRIMGFQTIPNPISPSRANPFASNYSNGQWEATVIFNGNIRFLPSIEIEIAYDLETFR